MNLEQGNESQFIDPLGFLRRQGKFVAMIGVEGAGATLHTRADKIGKGEAPFDDHSLIA